MMSSELDPQAYSVLMETAPETLLIPAALGIGKFIKNSNIDDEYIPIIVVLLTGVAGFILLHFDLESFLTGIRSGMFTVATHQGFKQLKRQKKKPKRKKHTVDDTQPEEKP